MRTVEACGEPGRGRAKIQVRLEKGGGGGVPTLTCARAVHSLDDKSVRRQFLKALHLSWELILI